MTTQARRPRSGAARPSTPKLPPITVARLEEATLLIERMVGEKASLFIEAQNDYREKHRTATDRPITVEEAGGIAAGLSDALGQQLADDPGGVVKQIQESDLRAYDEPQGQEVLLAAGLATAPALIDVVKRLVALVEMPPADFEAAREDGAEALDEALAVVTKTYDTVEIPVMRARAQVALDHVVTAAGVSPGEALRLVTRLVGQALGQALQMNPAIGSSSSSLRGSLDLDGPAGNSSTASPTGTPAS